MKGILIANLETELDRLRTKPPVTLPDIPADIMAAFDRQAYADEFTFSPLEGCNDFFKYWRLSPLSAHSKPNHPLEPSVKEYISFLKCIWLLRKMQKHFSTYAIYPQSHWLSFVRALEEVCLAFRKKKEKKKNISDGIVLDLIVANREID
jgi:hypothetical protein